MAIYRISKRILQYAQIECQLDFALIVNTAQSFDINRGISKVQTQNSASKIQAVSMGNQETMKLTS